MEQKGKLRLAGGVVGVLLAFAACSSDSSTSTSSGSSSSSSGSGSAAKAAACDTAPAAPAAAGSEVDIAFVGALTGDSANLGINIRDGAKTAIDAYNKSGGKYKVVLKEFDTAGDPAQATTIKDQFVNDNKIIGLIGPAFSGETKAVLPSIDEACLNMISASATNAALPDVVPGSKVFHRAIADDSFQGTGIGDYIMKTLKGTSIVVVDDNSEYGKGLADNTTKAIEADGGKVAKRLSVDPKAQDFSAAVNDAKAENPDVVMYAGYYQEAGRLRKQLTDGGVTAKFISGDGSLDPGFVTAAGSAGEGALLSCPCNLANAASTGDLLTFYNDYKADNNIEPGTYSPEAYDIAKIYLKMIDGGATDRAGIIKAIGSLGLYKGISKDIEFQTNGNIKTPSLFVFEVKNGQIAAAK